MITKVKIVGTACLLWLALTGCSLFALTPPKGLTAAQSRGWDTYTRRCAACHRIKGKGGGSARELTHIASVRDEAWLRKLIRNPKSIDPRAKMPPPNLSESQIDDLIDYFMTLR